MAHDYFPYRRCMPGQTAGEDSGAFAQSRKKTGGKTAHHLFRKLSFAVSPS
jgi:hypothetical protein